MLLLILAYLLIGFFIAFLMTTVKRFILSKVISTIISRDMDYAPSCENESGTNAAFIHFQRALSDLG